MLDMTQNIEIPQLRVCPLCGSKAVVRRMDWYYFYVSCTKEDCKLRTTQHYVGSNIQNNTEAMILAISDWNNRENRMLYKDIVS